MYNSVCYFLIVLHPFFCISKLRFIIKYSISEHQQINIDTYSLYRGDLKKNHRICVALVEMKLILF